MPIHPTAIVDKNAQIAPDAEIGPYCIVEGDTVLGPQVKLHPHVVVKAGTRIGRATEVYPQAVLGGEPQSSSFRGEKSYLIIGEHNIIRENVTIHRATGEANATVIGNHNLLMAYTHVGHDCQLGDHIILPNYSGVAGHVVVEDHVTFGAIVGVHQFVRIGKLAMIGGYSKVVQDVPPFMLVDGRTAEVKGPNVIGLHRAGIPPEVRNAIKMAYRLLCRSRLNTTQALERIEREVTQFEEIKYLVRFLREVREGSKGRALEPGGARGHPVLEEQTAL